MHLQGRVGNGKCACHRISSLLITQVASPCMARAKSPEKRQVLLESAVREIAEAGLGASTAKIAKGAGLAEGTMFTYAPMSPKPGELQTERKVSMLLHLSMVLSQATRERTHAERDAVAETLKQLGQCGVFRDLPPGFASAAMTAMQEAVMEMAAKKPRDKASLIERGFDAFWRMAEESPL